MKKFILMVAMTLMTATSVMAENNPMQTIAHKAAEVMLNEAVKLGYGSQSEKQKILQSGIVEEVTNTLIATNFDFAAAIDKAAEVSVREGWFKNEKAAKAALRQACEKARKDDSLMQKVYKALGL